MPTFQYKARDVTGALKTGNIEAANQAEVLDKMAEREFVPITVEQAGLKSTSAADQSLFGRINAWMLDMQSSVSLKDLVFFTRQLATMVGAGVPLVKSIQGLADTQQPVFKRILLEVAEDISGGDTFAEALAKHRKIFDDMFVSVVKSGEMSGKLDVVLNQLANYQERAQAIKAKVKGATRYPMVIAGILTMAMALMLFFMVPKFQNMYASMNAELPAITMLLVHLSEFLRTKFLLSLGIVIAIVMALRYYLKTEIGSRNWDYISIHMPVFGQLIVKNLLARMSRTLALLLSSGNPMVQSMEMVSEIMGNVYFSEAILNIIAELKNGEPLAEAFQKTGMFPSLVVQLIHTGEETGSVDNLLIKCADFYEREVNVSVDSLSSMMEPILIVVMGVVVGGMLLALYMPVFSIGEHMM
ncbi:MAG: type II secretion system F family protein [bacterium]